MTLKSVKQFLKFLSLSIVIFACAKQDNLEVAKKNFLLAEDQLAPVYKKNNVPADLQDSYIVVFKDDVAEDEIDSESERMCGGGKAQKERTFKYAVKGFSGRLSAATIEEFRRNPKVKYIEQNQVIKIVAIQESATWGIDRIDQPNLPLSTSYNNFDRTGSTVDVYIFDTGVRSDHIEFGGRVSTGYSAIAGQVETSDGNGHGTHVAGTVGGSIYGVAKGVKLIPVKVLGDNGSGTNAGVIAGLDWAADNHLPGKLAVGNMSLGGGGSTALDDAVRRCVADGIVMAVAAGNDNRDVNNILLPTSPARVQQAITVGASASNDAISTFSNFGSVVDIFAPGTAILSASPSTANSTATLSGTSMAAPHVAGAAALFLEYAPSSTPSQVEAGLKQFAAVGRITGLPTGTANNLLQINFGTVPSLPAPSVPTLSSPANAATNQSLTPTLTWLAATAATSYNLQVSTASNFSSPLINATGITTTSRAISGLANSTTYYWRVGAVNTTGTTWSAIRSFTTAAPLAIPIAPILSSPANLATNVSRTPTMSWGAVTGAATYDIEISTVTANFSTVTFGRTGITARSVRSSQLGSLVAYVWRVRARNAAGIGGPWSAPRSFTTRR
jgi:subtilisin family serine protease